ncbi:hypothetical protein BGZ57DRAFT_33248 [Hyaloscypha finlandica]|nr:hypothetical protein BGZ57DRAFT_33248 [Hyaloscypha finlandica]
MKEIAPQDLGPDFCVAIISFRSGVVARLTIGTVARRNRSMTITGDKGILHVPEIWDYEAPVQFTLSRGSTANPASPLLLVTPPTTPERVVDSPGVPMPERGIQVDTPADAPRQYVNAYRMNPCLGLAELAAAIREKRRPRMAADHAFHVYEISKRWMTPPPRPGIARLRQTLRRSIQCPRCKRPRRTVQSRGRHPEKNQIPLARSAPVKKIDKLLCWAARKFGDGAS